MTLYFKPSEKSSLRIDDLVSFDEEIIKSHPLYFFRCGKIDVWWSPSHQRFVASIGDKVFSSDDFRTLLKKLEKE